MLRPKTSLAVKLTAYFVIFGLIIGYTVFIFSTAYGGRNMLKNFSSIASRELDFTDIDFYNFNEIEFSENIQQILSSINIENFPINEFNAYVSTGEKWEKYSFIGHEIRKKNIEAYSDRCIQRALEKNIAFSSNPFFGKSDETTIYFKVSAPEPHELVIAATITRKGLSALLKDQSRELLGASIILIIFSFLLGKLFSITVTRPLRQLAEKAVKISEGALTIDLHTKRRDEIGVLSRTLKQMNDGLNEHLKAMEIMNRIDKAVLSSISRNDLLNRVVGFVCDYIDKSTVVMALRDNKSGGFELISAVKQSEPAILIDNPYIPDELLSRDTLKSFRQSCVFIEDQNLTEVLIKQLHLPENTKSFYNAALYLKEEYLGSLLIIRDDKKPFTEEQQRTLEKLGDQVGVAMQSVMAVEEVNSLQIGSIQALSRSIDTKSRWTAGHSERVAKLSELLGAALGMEEIQLRRLIISAMLHDIGKIGIPELILNKPGKLTDEEFATIKKHPELGFDITKSIPDYADICEGIRYHHEKWDGSGYPMQLKGKDIPLFGRIIAIADVFDALSSARPYREGWSFTSCIQFIEDKKNIDFDAELAAIFVETVKSSNNYLNNSEGWFKV